MSFVRLYGRVLDQLGPDRHVGWLLSVANVALAIALFAEPVLFGRVINVLAGAQANPASADWPHLWLLLLAWACFGLFTIVCATTVALFADRLAHRRRLAVLTSYFEHVLQLPLAYHGEVHSGRLMKIMLQGTDTLWSLWLGFFRAHLAAFVALIILVPLALTLTPSARPTRSATSHWCKASRASNRKCARSSRSVNSCWRRNFRCCHGGRW